MLVLTRKLNQSLYIDHDIRVQILEVSGGQVRIGIEAPRSKEIVREEILIPAKKVRETKRKSRLKVSVERV